MHHLAIAMESTGCEICKMYSDSCECRYTDKITMHHQGRSKHYGQSGFGRTTFQQVNQLTPITTVAEILGGQGGQGGHFLRRGGSAPPLFLKD